MSIGRQANHQGVADPPPCVGRDLQCRANRLFVRGGRKRDDRQHRWERPRAAERHRDIDVLAAGLEEGLTSRSIRLAASAWSAALQVLGIGDEPGERLHKRSGGHAREVDVRDGHRHVIDIRGNRLGPRGRVGLPVGADQRRRGEHGEEKHEWDRQLRVSWLVSCCEVLEFLGAPLAIGVSQLFKLLTRYFPLLASVISHAPGQAAGAGLAAQVGLVSVATIGERLAVEGVDGDRHFGDLAKPIGQPAVGGRVQPQGLQNPQLGHMPVGPRLGLLACLHRRQEQRRSG